MEAINHELVKEFYYEYKLSNAFEDILGVKLETVGMGYDDSNENDIKNIDIYCAFEDSVPDSLRALKPFEEEADEICLRLIGNRYDNGILFQAYLNFLLDKKDHLIELKGIKAFYGLRSNTFSY